MEDDEPSAVNYGDKAPRPKLSLTPSWIMLGFVLGALFVWLLPTREKPPAPPTPPKLVVQGPESPAELRAKRAKLPQKPARLTDIEAVFEAWGQYAIWDQNRTEVALWNSDKDAFADYYEVLRDNGVLYYRTIASLTRPVLTHGTKTESPLMYTETEEMRRQWLEARPHLVPARMTPTVPSPNIPVPAPQEIPAPTPRTTNAEGS